MLYSYDRILICMTNLLIYILILLNLIVSFKEADEHAYPQTVTDALNKFLYFPSKNVNFIIFVTSKPYSFFQISS